MGHENLYDDPAPSRPERDKMEPDAEYLAWWIRFGSRVAVFTDSFGPPFLKLETPTEIELFKRSAETLETKRLQRLNQLSRGISGIDAQLCRRDFLGTAIGDALRLSRIEALVPLDLIRSHEGIHNNALSAIFVAKRLIKELKEGREDLPYATEEPGPHDWEAVAGAFTVIEDTLRRSKPLLSDKVQRNRSGRLAPSTPELRTAVANFNDFLRTRIGGNHASVVAKLMTVATGTPISTKSANDWIKS